MIVFALPPHERLGRSIAQRLGVRLGRVACRAFSDGERYVRPVTPVHRERVAIVASTGPDAGQLLDLCILLHAIRSSGARAITLVVPYSAYSRQDRPDQP